jgi:hypothetical protein
MRSGLPSTLTLVLVLVLAGLAGAAGTPATASATDTLQERPPSDGSRIELRLAADGSARWVVEQRFVLKDANDTRAFERLADEFESGETDLGYYDAFERGREAASNATGREMRFENASRDSRIEPAGNVSVGVLERSFTWTNFSRVGGGVVQVDDAFRTADGGTWFPGITGIETFVVRPPDGYGVSSAPAATNEGVLRWDGPTEFEPGYLDITYERLATPTRSPTVSPTVSPTPTPTVSLSPGSPPTSTTPPEADRETLFLVGGLIGLGLLAVAVYLLARRGSGTDDGSAAAANGGTDDGGAVAAGAGADDGDPDPEPAPVDTELLSDEERVEHLLERNGGRMKQASIVDETGWSNAKVSQLLSAMDDADRINKLRIGRENLISLPDEDVTGFEE